MNFGECSAALLRADLADTVYLFGRPDFRLSGSWEEWRRLDEALKEQTKSGPDCLHPPGAAVGYFSYEGDFDFAFYPELRAVSHEQLFPEELERSHVPQDEDWAGEPGLEEYGRMIEAAQEHIRSGDIYQANLARRFCRAVPDFDARRFFQVLWQATGAPLSAYLECQDRILCSASPELFISLQGRRIRTQPIKGTRPRDRDGLRDRQNAFELATSPKEIAELVMITDLERNDLGAICEYGSVTVPSLLHCEAFSHVFHLISTVEGQLRGDISPVQAVRACFPGGSITGAPKRRAREIIAQLEPFRRGFYTGAIGYFGFDGSAQFNIAIRTAEYHRGKLSFFAGSGITADSDPVQEFEETEHKARALCQAFSIYQARRPIFTRKAGALS